MNNIKSLMSVVFLTGALGLSVASAGAEAVISKDVLADGSYCHTKFESIREDTLASSQPVLKDTDDIVDFYGACNHDPLGKEEIQSQKIEMQHRFQSEYNDWDFLIQLLGATGSNLLPLVCTDPRHTAVRVGIGSS